MGLDSEGATWQLLPAGSAAPSERIGLVSKTELIPNSASSSRFILGQMAKTVSQAETSFFTLRRMQQIQGVAGFLLVGKIVVPHITDNAFRFEFPDKIQVEAIEMDITLNGEEENIRRE